MKSISHCRPPSRQVWVYGLVLRDRTRGQPLGSGACHVASLFDEPESWLGAKSRKQAHMIALNMRNSQCLLRLAGTPPRLPFPTPTGAGTPMTSQTGSGGPATGTRQLNGGPTKAELHWRYRNLRRAFKPGRWRTGARQLRRAQRSGRRRAMPRQCWTARHPRSSRERAWP